MGAPSFSFKQFTVFHDKCAMKVGTDGVLLGAWANVEKSNSILDIGTGSGLIALMLAQRSKANITAIDIDKNAVIQAKINAENSQWTDRIQILESDLMEFSNTTNQQFDLIVSNPPFFKNSLETPELARTIARHATTDFHNKIIISSLKLLTENGKLCLILPINEGNECIAFAIKNGLCCTKKITVFPKPTNSAKRLLIEFSKQNVDCFCSELVIESEVRHSYTKDFTALVKDFYLKL
jgi:tRNA1Val (adenine37-N6)-methyltransferase